MSANKWEQMSRIREHHKELAKRILIDKENIELPPDFRERKNYIWSKLDNRFWGRKMYAIMGGPEAYEALMSLIINE